MKNFIKNKALLTLGVYNLIAFIFFFVVFIIDYVNSYELIGYAHVLSLLTYLFFILFSFILNNLLIFIYCKRQNFQDKIYSGIFLILLFSIISVYSIYLIFSIPISIHNILFFNSYGVQYPIINIINLIVVIISSIVFITYSSILLHKELKLRKLSHSSSRN